MNESGIRVGGSVRVKVVKAGPAPECFAAGRLVCRGCPGWEAMMAALMDPDTHWNIIHCPATGLTLARDESPPDYNPA